MALTLSPWVKSWWEDNNGDPAAGHKLFTYAAGTTTKQATYSNSAGSSANTNPIILDSAGRATVFLLPSTYKYVLAPPTDSDPPTAPIWTVDNIEAVPEVEADVDIQGTAGEDLFAGTAVFLSDGTGGLTAGRWYRTSSSLNYASSTAPLIGMLPGDGPNIPVGTVGSVRIMGRVAGLSGLTAGSTYYVDTTNGAITGNIRALQRMIGVADSTTSLIMGASPKAQTRENVVVVHTITATVGNVGAGEDILDEYTAPAGDLLNDGAGYRCTYWGKTANNAGAKQSKIIFFEAANITNLITFVYTINEAGRWWAQANIIRSGAAACRAHAYFTVGPAGGPVSKSGTDSVTTNATLANACKIRLTAEATLDNDITVEGGRIEVIKFP